MVFCAMSAQLSLVTTILFSLSKITVMFVAFKLRRLCDKSILSFTLRFNSLYLPSKLLEIPPPVVACLNPSFHARRLARCHLKNVTDAQLIPEEAP